MRCNQIKAVEPNLHRIVHHVGPPRRDFKTAPLLARQVVDFGRRAIFGVAQVVRVQHEVAERKVVVVEGREAGFLLGFVKIVEFHREAADVGLVQRHLPGQALAGGGLVLVGGLIELAHGFGGVHHPLFHRNILVLGVGESGIFERKLVQRHQLLLQVNVLRRDVGQANSGANVLARWRVLVHEPHAVERGVAEAELHRNGRGRSRIIHLRSRFGLHDADGSAVQGSVIYLIDGLIHIHLVHVGGELADARPNVRPRHLVELREVDIGEPGLTDVVLQG